MKRNNFYKTLLLMAFCGMAFVGCEKDDASGERDGRVDMSIVPVSPEDNQICYTATCQLDGIDFFAEATDHLYNSETGCGCVTFGSTVTEIPEQAFWDNQDITTITLPATVTTIGKEAFAGCSLLSSATMPGHKNSGNFVKDMTNDGKLLTDKKDSGRTDEIGETIYYYKFNTEYALPYFFEDNDKTKSENDYLDLGDEYYVLPQNIDDLSNLLVDYTVFALDDEGYILSSTRYNDVKVQLNEITLTKNNIAEPIDTWKINGFYTYRLLISPYGEPILFDPAINDWDKVTADPYTIYSE